MKLIRDEIAHICLVFVLVVFTSFASAQSTNVNVQAWGDNSEGKCNVPESATNVITVQQGGSFALALRVDGTIVLWGDNSLGQCNIPESATNIIKTSLGYDFALALRADGNVVAWGDNSVGQCNVPASATNIIAVAAAKNYTQAFSLALRADGSIIAWGDNTHGQCNVPASATNVVNIIAGSTNTSVAIRSDGTLVAWGGSSSNLTTVPKSATNVIGVVANELKAPISCFFLAVKTQGPIVGWGNNTFGQLTIPSSTSGSIAAVATETFCLALKSNGTVVAWGNNAYGQTSVPPSATNVIAIAAGGHYDHGFSLALRSDGSILSWGNNSSGQTNIPPTLFETSQMSVNGDTILVCGNPLLAAAPPVILGQPLSQTAPTGGTVILEVYALGAGSLTYQWCMGTNNILTATNDTLVITGAQPMQSGQYYCIVSNNAGLTQSHTADINVVSVLGINMIPAVSILGQTGWSYKLQYIQQFGPTDAWVDLATIAITNEPQYYFDVSAIGQPSRLYRLVQMQ